MLNILRLKATILKPRFPLSTNTLFKLQLPYYANLQCYGTSIQQLPPKVGFKLFDVKSSAQTQKGIGFSWQAHPKTVLVIKKPNDTPSNRAFVELCQWLHTQLCMNIIIEPHIPKEIQNKLSFSTVFTQEDIPELKRVVDFIVTLGGDGSILHVSSLFNTDVPPLISFSMGRLGFLLPFPISDFQKELARLILGKVTLLKRNRLSCKFNQQTESPIIWGGEQTSKINVANEVNVHRGVFPHLTSINCYVDDLFLTNGIADGLIVATPTGSTAYSLSAGGPIVHPSIEGLLLTPICPRSLSFRPVILPSNSTLKLSLHHASRSSAQVSLDGREASNLECGDSIEVTQSKYPLLSVNRIGEGEDWTRDINHLLKWNQNFSPAHLNLPDESSSE